MGNLRKILRNSLTLAALAWVLLLGFIAQSPLAMQHECRHFSERLAVSTQSAPVLESAGCVICDSAHWVPETPRMVFALAIRPFVGAADQLPPAFLSDNAILFPLGARAPPARQA